MPSLETLTLKQVLLGVGALAALLGAIRLAFYRRAGPAAWLSENVQVLLSVGVVVFLLIRPFVFQAFYIPSSSMEPTLLGPRPLLLGGAASSGGDRLLVNRLIYRVSHPRRFDIAVFKAPPAAAPDEKEYIKRVIALPGETVEVVPPRLLVDGRALLRLSTGPNELLRVTRDTLPLTPADNQAQFPVMTGGFQSSTLQVIVQPNPQLSRDEFRVDLNGGRLLTDDAGRIRCDTRPRDYGADPEIEAELCTVAGEPRLIVARGAKLEYDPGHVLVNGRRLPEPYLAVDPRYSMPPRALDPGEYFMMGDNRNDSNDSHVWGPVTRDRFIGRAEILFWPLTRARLFHWWLLAAGASLLAAYHLLAGARRAAWPP